jgi:hypothetical protein
MNNSHIIFIVAIFVIVMAFVFQSLENKNVMNGEREYLGVVSRMDDVTSPNLYHDYACDKCKFLEHFEHFDDERFNPDFSWLAYNNLLPWWNSTRHTRNSSWDIRGDVPVPYYYVGPWLNSPLI